MNAMNKIGEMTGLSKRAAKKAENKGTKTEYILTPGRYGIVTARYILTPDRYGIVTNR